MSDTDDTDDLLLIPPDFFLLDSDTNNSNIVGPYYSIVDNLIQKVNSLQDRIKSIETSSDFLSNSLDCCLEYSQTMHNNADFHKYNSTDQLYTNSTQNTPQRPYSKFKNNSLPASPNLDRFNAPNNRVVKELFRSPSRNLSPRSSKQKSPKVKQTKEDAATLGEIDTFLSKVKTIQRLNAVRNLENDFDNCETSSAKRNCQEVDQLLEDFKLQQQQIKSRAEDQNELLKNTDPPVVKEKTWRSGDNKESVPDFGMGFRDSLYSESNKHTNDYKALTKPHSDSNSWISVDKYDPSDSSADSTLLTAYNKFSKNNREQVDYPNNGDFTNVPLHFNALNVLNMHRQVLEDSHDTEHSKSKQREHKPRGTNTISNNLGLMSLADIWSKPSEVPENPTQNLQKLQEERLRRQHCETLIQELQNRNLEQQQKLSVAVKVDESKNNTIRQLQDALEKIFTRLEKLNKEKQEWDHEKSRLQEQHSKELEEASQKVVYYEKEASKALNLAHGNQEKLNSLEGRCADLQNKLQAFEIKFEDVQNNYASELEGNKQLSERLRQKEAELKESKSILNEAKTEVVHSKKAVEVCQADFTAMKSECMKLQADLKNEKHQIMQLNEQRRKLLNEVESFKSREIELKEELEQVRKQLETNKIELRNYYQGQVEILVQNKLKDFQTQLDQAEDIFKEEIKKREMSIAKTAATHIQQISEKSTLEIKLLEKKHQEESKLYHIQIMQYKQQVESLQNKLDMMHEKRVDIAKQLQKIMESQWTEALRIISSGKSPTFNEGNSSAIDQLNSLKTKSYNNVEEVLAQQQEEQFNMPRRTKVDWQYAASSGDRIYAGSNNNDKNVSEMYNNVPMDTPVSSRPQGNKHYSENEVQKYINLLLNRPPGNPTQEVQRDNEKYVPEHVSERTSWQPSSDQESISRTSLKGPQKRSLKPPWK